VTSYSRNTEEEKIYQRIRDILSDLVGDLVYYDRKEDEDLSHDQLQAIVKSGAVTVEEMLEYFGQELRAAFR
jgi:hypothetical protein